MDDPRMFRVPTDTLTGEVGSQASMDDPGCSEYPGNPRKL